MSLEKRGVVETPQEKTAAANAARKGEEAKKAWKSPGLVTGRTPCDKPNEANTPKAEK